MLELVPDRLSSQSLGEVRERNFVCGGGFQSTIKTLVMCSEFPGIQSDSPIVLQIAKQEEDSVTSNAVSPVHSNRDDVPSKQSSSFKCHEKTCLTSQHQRHKPCPNAI